MSFPAIKIVPLLQVLLVSVLNAEFDFRIAPEAGFQTGVPDKYRDTLLESYPFCAFELEPSWEADSTKKIRYQLSSPANLTKFLGGPFEFTISPNLVFEKAAITYTSSLKMEVAYNFVPAALHPTLPEHYLEYSLGYEREKGHTVRVTGNYEVVVLHEIAVPRLDLKNTASFGVGWNVTGGHILSIKIGGAWNISNKEGTGYIQPYGSGNVIWTLNDQCTILLQAYAAYAFYEPQKVLVWNSVQRGRWGKVFDTLSYEYVKPKVPLYTFYCGLDRQITLHTGFHIYYNFTLFSVGDPHSMSISHHMGIICEWHRE